jgi:hypothetical protein
MFQAQLNQTPMGYRSQAADTSIEADMYLFTRLRQLSLKQRVEMFASHDRGVKKLCLIGIKSKLCAESLDYGYLISCTILNKTKKTGFLKDIFSFPSDMIGKKPGF